MAAIRRRHNAPTSFSRRVHDNHKDRNNGRTGGSGFPHIARSGRCDAMDTEPLPLPIEREHLHCTKHGSAQLDCWYDCHDPECIMTDRADLTEEFRRRLIIPPST